MFSPRSLKHVNLMGNTCISEDFADAYTKTLFDRLSRIVNFKHWNLECGKTESAEVKPICEVIEKCSLGEKCCRLSKFESASRLELLTLEQYWDSEIDVIFYDNNPKVEYLLATVGVKFGNLKVYDASNCAVREIFWENFKWTDKVEFINLANNQISALTGEMYDRMPLKSLDLCNFK